MSRLVIPTNSEAQNVVEGLYKDLERRIIASPPGLCPVDLTAAFLKMCRQPSGPVPGGNVSVIFAAVPCTDLRQMRSLPNRSRAALQSSGRHPKRKRNHEAFNHAGGNSPCHRKHG